MLYSTKKLIFETALSDIGCVTEYTGDFRGFNNRPLLYSKLSSWVFSAVAFNNPGDFSQDKIVM
jgi:hypothetical protein